MRLLLLVFFLYVYSLAMGGTLSKLLAGIVKFAVIVALADTICNIQIEQSVQSMIRQLELKRDGDVDGTNQRPPNRHLEAFEEAKALLQREIKAKAAGQRLSVWFCLFTVVVGQVTIWVNPIQAQGGWELYAPSAVTAGVSSAFYFFLNALDNIQDEVSLIGKPRVFDLVVLSILTLLTAGYLLWANRLYFVKGPAMIFGAVLAKTCDTTVWNIVAVATMSFIALTAVSLTLVEEFSVPGPEWIQVFKLIVARCSCAFVYEAVTAKGNAWKAPNWLVKVAAGDGLHHLYYCIAICSGLFPVGWLPSELVAGYFSFQSNIRQHSRNLALIQEYEYQRKSSRNSS